MSYASDRYQASLRHVERSYERMLAAGPPEPITATVSFHATVFPEGPYDSAAQIEAWLRSRVDKNTTITLASESGDEVVAFDVEGELEEVESIDHGIELVEDLLTGGDHDMVVESVKVDDPEEAYEPDWDTIRKDRLIDEIDF